MSGRFGLRAAPGAIATPAFGEGPESARIAGTTLVHEIGGEAIYVAVDGSTMRELADVVGADLEQDFSCGEDTPELGDVDAPIHLAAEPAAQLIAWFELGARILDQVLGGLGAAGSPATVQLWPEHFDLATNVAVGPDRRVNLGVSSGDGFSDVPYLYIGPWGTERPGDPQYWNAPFGAVLSRSDLSDPDGALGSGVHFFESGIGLLAGPTPESGRP